MVATTVSRPPRPDMTELKVFSFFTLYSSLLSITGLGVDGVLFVFVSACTTTG
jgi:hypothetical protein